ncbi:MAG TPA: porin family protein [Candidatus Krumholzibacteria bacterium]|nr:porin family protein [Candidatus Krumholzibacteria bacterium]
MTRNAMVCAMALALVTMATGALAAKNQVGVKGGVAIEKLGGSDVESDQIDSRTGFVGGGYFQTDLSRNFGLRVEALYFAKGASTDSLGLKVTIKVDYLEFPILAVVNVPMSETSRLSIFGGPTLGFNVSSKLAASYMGYSASVGIGDAITTFEFGMTFGAGVSFDAGSAIIGVDGRYGFGLTTIADTGYTADFGVPNADVKNKGFAIMGSIGFPVGAK